MTTPAAAVQRTHQKAVRFFWVLLISATAVTLVGNVAHAVLPLIPRVSIQIGAPQCLPSPFSRPCMASPLRYARVPPARSTVAPFLRSESSAWVRSP